MAAIDIAIIIVTAVAGIAGFRKGLIAQAGSLAAIIIAIVACRLLGPETVRLIMPHGEEVTAMQRYGATVLAYGGIYIVAYYAVVIVTKLLKVVVHTLLMGPLDRIGGAVVNIIKWMMVMSVVLNMYMALFPTGGLIRSSHIAGGAPVQFIVELAPAAWGAFTEKLQD